MKDISRQIDQLLFSFGENRHEQPEARINQHGAHQHTLTFLFVPEALYLNKTKNENYDMVI